MKHLSIAFLLFLAPVLRAQSTYPDPEYVKRPMLFDAATQTITPIERQKRPLKQTSVGYQYTMVYEKAHSSFRVKKSPEIQFLVKLANAQELDLMIDIYALRSNERTDQRILEVRSNIQPFVDTGLPFRYKKVGTDLYLITLENLPAGEYMWRFDVATYLFGVD